MVKLCDYCPHPLSLYCTTCHTGLCSACLARHLEIDTDRGHYVCFYRDRKLPGSIGKYCRKHAPNICDFFCTSCFQSVCFECLNNELHHTTISIQALMRQNLKRVQDDMQVLSSVLVPKYDAIKATVDSKIEEHTGEVNMVPYVLARSLNLQSHSRLFLYECRRFQNPFLDEIEAHIKRCGSTLPPELMFISFRIELRKYIINRRLEKLAKRLMNHRFLQKSRLRVQRCLILTKLSDSDFFEEVNRVIESSLPRPISATNKAKSAKQYTKRFPKPRQKTVIRLDRSEKEKSIDDVNNDSAHFIVGNDGRVLVITVLTFAHGGNSRMHGVVFQNAHGEVVFDDKTEIITQKAPLHCVVASTSDRRHLLAASEVLIEIQLMEKSIKTIQKQDNWKYVDMTCTFSRFLLVIEGKQLQPHQREYRITRCDLNGNILQKIDFDTKSLEYPFKIRERIDGDMSVLDRNSGSVHVLNASGRVEKTYNAANASRFIPHLILPDKFGNTIIYDKGRSMIQITDKDLRDICKIPFKGSVLLGFCVDIDDRLVCLCRGKEERFEIQIYDYI